MRNKSNRTQIIAGACLVIIGMLVTFLGIYMRTNKDKGGESVSTPTPAVQVTVTPKPTPTKKPTVIWGDKDDVAPDGPGVTVDNTPSTSDKDDGEVSDIEKYDKYITVKPDGSIVIDFDSYSKDYFGENSEEVE